MKAFVAQQLYQSGIASFLDMLHADTGKTN
jgi:hypothetical protein